MSRPAIRTPGFFQLYPESAAFQDLISTIAGASNRKVPAVTIRFVRDQGRLPLRQLLPFVLRSGLGVSEALRQFRDVRRWVARNRYRFTQDARRVTELWEVDE